MYNDDRDIKIFSFMKKTDEPEAVVIADEMKRQAISGNLQKAKTSYKYDIISSLTWLQIQRNLQRS